MICRMEGWRPLSLQFCEQRSGPLVLGSHSAPGLVLPPASLWALGFTWRLGRFWDSRSQDHGAPQRALARSVGRSGLSLNR